MGSLNLFDFHFQFMFGYCLKAAHTDRIPSAVYIEFSGKGWGNLRHLLDLRRRRLKEKSQKVGRVADIFSVFHDASSALLFIESLSGRPKLRDLAWLQYELSPLSQREREGPPSNSP
jgi:hypothetical protein